MRAHADFIETHHHPRWPIYVIGRIIDFLFTVLYTLLVVRLLLELVGASHSSGFFQFILRVTDPFFAPFRGIVGNTALYGGHAIVWPLVIAIVVCMIVHAILRALLRLLARA